MVKENYDEIQPLIHEIESKYGNAITTSNDFERLSDEIENTLNERISSSTLKRLWGYVNYVNTPRKDTLDLLAKYVGFKNFIDFHKNMNSEGKSEFIKGHCISVDQLHFGDVVEFSWKPDRHISAVYLGNSRFRVKKAENSKVCIGNEFITASFVRNVPLYISILFKEDEEPVPFVAGKDSGLQEINVIANDSVDSSTSGSVSPELPVFSEGFTSISPFHTSSNGYNVLYSGTRNGKRYILKGLTGAYRDNPSYIALLKKEFDIIFSLDHPNVCKAVNFEQVDRYGYMEVVEYIDGCSLKERMKMPISEHQFRKIINQLCDALKYIHKKQVVHRDLKPDNIMITYRGDDVKIIDFGLADASMYDSLKIMAGTERYSAPELLSGGNVDARADIYSVGVIIEDMISANHLPCYLKRVAAKCCQANPDDRYCDVESLEAAISDRRVQLWQRFLVPLLVIVTTVVLLLSLSSLFKH